MNAYASVEDLRRLRPSLSDSDEERARALLESASLQLRAKLKRRGADPQGLAEELRAVCAAMVARAMSCPASMAGVSQLSQGAIGFTGTVSYANPSGDLYVTKAEREMLGLTGGRACRAVPGKE